MRPWLTCLATATDEHTTSLFSPDVRIQAVLAVEKASKLAAPKGDMTYTLLYEALQVCSYCCNMPLVSDHTPLL